ncbi:MAG: TIGR04283 family arsenosugar biosynthesis glycosyltransferase [Candidatus Cloacimonetes bacterium]|nr:TIGR04283 family arsenosugar biosynthesis glycosyltransferase [Candidatus Cloacimonadota bacterium]MCF7812983.1 TIGR04283 family arsenosugar biosynthesis glycosyltransferase [Candidatus Cloacimonadota bacterium]MCF7867285.1 TIGR04283 family arsenosugar biosynthesis glycosyltransferase [Candidatus Cloacimonadota bacterium]MCF7882729.1 TIGR04283 family arsenosugar biosynthesis glycosyltransferase [Candidatus Cloacimonadota bacterium]
MISIIIPVYDEPQINSSLAKLRSQEYKHLEIIVVDGDENAKTLNLIEDDNVIKIASRPGRAVQMNAGAKKAKGDVLLFLHADSLLPENGLKMIDQIIKSGFKAGAFDIWFESRNWLIREVISRTASLRSRLFRIPYGDQGQFFSRFFFHELGGYAEIPIMEDIQIMKRVRSKKEKVFIIPHKVRTSARRWEEEGIFFVMLRNPILSGLFFLGVPAEKLIRFYPRAKDKS